jgi:hypothetical protein
MARGPARTALSHASPTYATDRICVVVSGIWWVNCGPEFDPENSVPMPAGGFVRRAARTAITTVLRPWGKSRPSWRSVVSRRLKPREHARVPRNHLPQLIHPGPWSAEEGADSAPQGQAAYTSLTTFGLAESPTVRSSTRGSSAPQTGDGERYSRYWLMNCAGKDGDPL